jgi:benzodiazapine receptor
MEPTAVSPSRPRQILVLLALFVVCFAVAGLGGYWTSTSLARWYVGLRKPAWNPPSSVFGPVWTFLYAAMAVAAWLVWRRTGLARGKLPLLLFAVQLLLNLAWSGLFFGLRRPDLAFLDIVLLWLAILATLLSFRTAGRGAAALMLPYLLWVSFAATLNFAIWRLNT